MDKPERKSRFHARHAHGHPHRRRGRRGRGTPLERFVEPCVLLLLCDGPTHGYDLRDRLIELGLAEGKLDMGNLYRTLRRMEEDDWLVSTWIKDQPGPQKRVYEINEEGREALQAWSMGIEHLREVLTKFLNMYESTFGKEG